MAFKTLKDVKVGDIIYVYNRHYGSLKEKVVEKVGRKYITTDFGTKFTFDGVEVSAYTPNQYAYAERAEYDAEVHMGSLKKSIKDFMGSYYFGLGFLNVSQLERIVEILKENA